MPAAGLSAGHRTERLCALLASSVTSALITPEQTPPGNSSRDSLGWFMVVLPRCFLAHGLLHLVKAFPLL